MLDHVGGVTINSKRNLYFERAGGYKMMELMKPYKLSEIINTVAEKLKENGIENQILYEHMGFYVYTREWEDLAKPDIICYLDNPPEIDEEDNEIYPSFVIKENLKMFISDENLENIISSALFQKIEASTAELIDAINYYMDNDCFIQF